jgi:predicted exporter
LPSAGTQARRRSAIPDGGTLQGRLAAATADTPFRPGAFAAFLAAAEATRALPDLTPASYPAGDFAADVVASHLDRAGSGYRAVTFLGGLADPAPLVTRLAGLGNDVALVDLKAASESLVRRYRERLTSVLSAALLAIAVLLAGYTRSPSRFVWSLGTVAAAVAVALAVVNLWLGPLTLFHLVGLVLVAGLGVDYCLFYSRPGVSRSEFRDTRHAIVAAAASTSLAFAILGTSSVPLLAAMGATVAVGSATAFAIARFGCRAVGSTRPAA